MMRNRTYLDLEGKMRAAVPVEKARGRQILEAVERTRIAPALLEQTKPAATSSSSAMVTAIRPS